MFNPSDNFFKQFIKSPYHAWLLGLTLGIGFLSANVVVMGICVGLYVLGWVHLPDMAMYKNWVKANMDRIAAADDATKIQAFTIKRTALIQQLSNDRLKRYRELSAVCEDIVSATKDSSQIDGTDPRLRKLDELMWTFLRLLVMEGTLENFIDTESSEGLPVEIKSCKGEVEALTAQVAAQPPGSVPIKQRLLDSKKEKLATLEKRKARLDESSDNLTLVSSEQERLVEQIKLLRSDAIASRNADGLTERINSTVDHLTETNKMISEMDQFKDLAGDDLPTTSTRLGFAADVNASDDEESPRRRTRSRVSA